MVEKYEKDKNGRWVRQDEKKGKKKGLIRGLLLVVLVLLLLLLLRTCSGGNKKPSGITQGVIDLPNREDAQKLVNEAVEEGMFQVFMNTAVPVGEDGLAELLIQNSANNHYSAYVEIYHGQELFYRSELIEPGYKLERDRLLVDLAPGSYSCTAQFHVQDTDTGEEINTVGLSIQITKE